MSNIHIVIVAAEVSVPSKVKGLAGLDIIDG